MNKATWEFSKHEPKGHAGDYLLTLFTEVPRTCTDQRIDVGVLEIPIFVQQIAYEASD